MNAAAVGHEQPEPVGSKGMDPMTQHQAAAAHDGVKLAATLDDATIRRVFPGAPADTSVPDSIGAIRKAALRAKWRSHGTAFGVIGGVLVVAAFVCLALGAPVAAAVSGGLVLAMGAAFYFWATHDADDEFFARYATARGLSHQTNGHIRANVPLLRKGDKREYPHVMLGAIAGQPAQFGHYTYTDVSYDEDGNKQETDHHYTLLAFQLPPAVAARYRGVYVRRKGLSLGALQDKLQHDRKVELESADFHKRYSLRVIDDQDDIALYELFSTSFIDMLATNVHVYWEQVGADLLFYADGHEGEAADLDAFCLQCWQVLHRYLEEYQ